MEEFLTQALTSIAAGQSSDAEYERRARQLVKTFSETPQSVLVDRTSGGDDLLDVLHPSENTLAYTAVLAARISVQQGKAGQGRTSLVRPDEPLFQKLVAYLEGFDPIQVRYAGSAFVSLVQAAVETIEQSSQPWLAVSLLRDVILRLDPNSSTLTFFHLHLVYLCLRLKLYREALPILDLDIYHVPSLQDRRPAIICAQESSVSYLNPATGLTNEVTSRDYLQYFMHAALVHIALRRWRRALVFLQIVLLTPTSGTASLIQVEAYKKSILIGLLMNGRSVSLPRTIHQQTLKIIKALSRPYDVIVEAFESRDFQRLQGDVEAGRQEGVWSRDQNLGLVYEVIKAFRKFSVLRLADTFAALPISDVARRTSPDPTDLQETQQYISDLILSGDLKASITHDSGSPILRFLSMEATNKTETQLQLEMENQKAKLGMLLELIADNDYRVELSREYVEHLQRLKRSRDDEEKASKATGVAGGKGGSGPFGADALDEDVMADT